MSPDQTKASHYEADEETAQPAGYRFLNQVGLQYGIHGACSLP